MKNSQSYLSLNTNNENQIKDSRNQEKILPDIQTFLNLRPSFQCGNSKGLFTTKPGRANHYKSCATKTGTLNSSYAEATARKLSTNETTLTSLSPKETVQQNFLENEIALPSKNSIHWTKNLFNPKVNAGKLSINLIIKSH